MLSISTFDVGFHFAHKTIPIFDVEFHFAHWLHKTKDTQFLLFLLWFLVSAFYLQLRTNHGESCWYVQAYQPELKSFDGRLGPVDHLVGVSLGLRHQGSQLPRKKVSSIAYEFKREFCTIGRQLAGRATVQIEEEGGGLLFYQGDELYLLTAAHVLIMLNDEFQLKFRAAGSKFSFLLVERFVHRDYVVDGNRDIGIARIELVDKEFLATTAKEKVLIHSNGVDGRKVAGFHQSCLLPGNIVERFSTGRTLVFGSSSKPGCSGSPMFDSKGQLYGCVHGSSKHRGRIQANLSINLVSEKYFIDALLPTDGFNVVANEKLNLLQIADDINPDALDDLSVLLDMSSQEGSPCDNLHRLAEELEMKGTVSVGKVMEKLGDTVLQSQRETWNFARDVELCVMQQ